MKMWRLLFVFILYVSLYITALWQKPEEAVENTKKVITDATDTVNVTEVAEEKIDNTQPDTVRLELTPYSPEVLGIDDVSPEVYFGSMEIQLPEGWKVESRVSEEGQTQCVLIDNHSETAASDIYRHHPLYEHEIVITCYKAQNLPQSRANIIADLMDYFGFVTARNAMKKELTPEENLWLLYAQKENSMEYHCLLSHAQDGQLELFLVEECEIQSAVSVQIENFRDFAEQKDIWLNDGYDVLTKYNDSYNDSYRRLNWDTEDAVLLKAQHISAGYNVLFYRKNQYSCAFDGVYLPTYTIGVERLKILDINEDGYEDFIPCMFTQYLPEDKDYYAYLWSHDAQTLEYISGAELTEKYGNVLFGQEVQPDATTEEYIPQSLLDYLTDLVLQGEDAVLRAMDKGSIARELSVDEVNTLSKQSEDIKLDKIEIGTYHGYGWWYSVDVDNDGIEDVFLEKYMGGTMGLAYHIFYQGGENGELTRTETFDGFMTDYAFIEWEGKNYLVLVSFDYNKKEFMGVKVLCFKEGECKDFRRIMLKASEEEPYKARMTYLVYEKYRPFAEALREFNVLYDLENHPTGTAEHYDEAERKWKSDLNNDGDVEQYSKYVWYPSNLATRQELIFYPEQLTETEEKEARRLYDIIQSDEGCPMLLWVDETEFGNVTYILYEDELYDFHISAYLIKKNNYLKLLEVEYTFTLETETERLF